MRTIQGGFEARGRRFAVVASRFNDVVVQKLVDGAASCLRKHGIAEDDLDLVWVPGAFELPLAAKRLAGSGGYDAVICLGAVIRGETDHYDFVCTETARGVMRVQLDTGVPCAFGVLTCQTMEQALARAGGGKRDQGRKAAAAVLSMAALRAQLASG